MKVLVNTPNGKQIYSMPPEQKESLTMKEIKA
jgi:hypothetical protein